MAYERANWENLPSTKTPVNATNLNKLNDEIDAKANSNDVYTKTETDTKLNKKVNTSNLIDLIYPVGSIYMSVNSTNPSTLFGGTWEQIKDKFLLSAGDTYNAGDEGGEATHTLTVDEMPNRPFLFNEEGKINVGSGSGTVTAGIGGGQAHNNMPPYLAVYMWKRIS